MTGNVTLDCNEPILDDHFKSQLKESVKIKYNLKQ